MNTAFVSARPQRLTDDQVNTYRSEGYLMYREPVFSPEEFAALREHFEHKLAALPPDVRPETMDVPHFTDPALFRWLLSDAVLDLVEPILGPDIVLFSSHFICKPKGNGKRVPWHEDSAYWKTTLEPMEVATVWLAIDASTTVNGCMQVIPRTHRGPKNGFSDYDPVDPARNVFSTEITKSQRDDSKAVACELQPNQASLHDARLIHGSPPNTSHLRRCGYTMRYMPASVRLNDAARPYHNVYLARGRNLAGSPCADPTRSYPELARYRETHGRNGH
ncbi:MAG: phytanoyl-CoA dioxygenase family protein [Limisphaerales bacterium]